MEWQPIETVPDALAEIRKLAQQIIEAAFEIPAPNAHTPKLVILADAIQRIAVPPPLPKEPAPRWWSEGVVKDEGEEPA